MIITVPHIIYSQFTRKLITKCTHGFTMNSSGERDPQVHLGIHIWTSNFKQVKKIHSSVVLSFESWRLCFILPLGNGLRQEVRCAQKIPFRRDGVHHHFGWSNEHCPLLSQGHPCDALCPRNQSTAALQTPPYGTSVCITQRRDQHQPSWSLRCRKYATGSAGAAARRR